VNIPDEVLYPLEAAMEQWTDARVIPAEDLQDLLLFVLKMPFVLSQFGMRLGGFSCRQKHTQTLMTVKVQEGDIPLVAFITANSTIGCMARFLSLFEDDKLTWSKDKYPWN
jgi:hypothetical protein